MIEVEQHLDMRLTDRLHVREADEPVDVRIDCVLRVTDVAHLIEMDSADIFAKEDVFQLSLRLLVEHDTVAVEHPDVGGATVEGRHLDVHGATNWMLAGVVLHHGDGQLAEVDDGRA